MSTAYESTPGGMAACPMATMCKGMMRKPFSGVSMMVAGIVFVVLGVSMLIEPTIMLWIVASAFVLFGAMAMMMAGFMRRMFRRSETDRLA